MRRTFILTAALGLFLTGCHSNRETGGHDKQSHQFIAANHVRWEAGPPSLPPGAKMAVLEGDLSKPGFFTFRATLPDGTGSRRTGTRSMNG